MIFGVIMQFLLFVNVVLRISILFLVNRDIKAPNDIGYTDIIVLLLLIVKQDTFSRSSYLLLMDNEDHLNDVCVYQLS